MSMSPSQSQNHQQTSAPSRAPSYTATTTTTTTTGGGSGNGNVLVATGKKRKRLQRACVACHKAKRRCDGGLPCSNCDFSGRLCSYNDSQGKPVSPTKRSLKPSETAAALQEQIQQYQQGVPVPASYFGSSSSTHSQQSSPSMTHHDILNNESATTLQQIRLEPSLESRRELLSIFFSHLSPMSSVFDEISFLRDLSSMEVSQVLLYSMYAVSASHAYDTHHHQLSSNVNKPSSKYTKLVAEAGNGSKYVKEARRLLTLEDERTGESLMDGRPNLEAAQSLYLLAFYEFNQGHYFRASSYIQLSSKHVTCLAVEDQSLHSLDDDSNARSLRKRNIKRLTCLVTAMDVSLGLMNGQSMSTKQWNIELAIDATSTVVDDDDEETMAMTQLVQISLVLNTAIELIQRKGVQSSDFTTSQAAQCSANLHRWADRLPHYLHFDEIRLKHVEQVLNERNNRPRSPNSTLQMNKGSAVCWTLMHSMAETTTLLLQELAILPDRNCKLAACKSLVLLLEQSNPVSLPRLFASFTIAVLYSVSSTISNQSQDREWDRIWEKSRTFAIYIGLGETIWSTMANWWKRRNHSISNSPQRSSPTSSTSGGRRLTINSSPSITTPTTSTLPSPPLSNYHYLHPIPNMSSITPNLAPTLPPLRLSISSEKSSRHFWDQPQRAAMTVNPS